MQGTGFVQPSACLGNNTGTARCVLESTSCADDEIFLSRRQLEDSVSWAGFAVDCKVEDQTVGSCDDGSTKICTSVSNSCLDPQSFEPLDEICRVDMPSESSLDARYGSCHTGDKNQCRWSGDSCPGVWIPAASATVGVSTEPCRCQDVATGACVTETEPDTFYCAVSVYACDEDSEYWNEEELSAVGYSCYLCEMSNDFGEPESMIMSTSGQRDRTYITVSVASSVGVLLVGFIIYRLMKKPVIPPLLSEPSRMDSSIETNSDDFSSLSSSVQSSSFA